MEHSNGIQYTFELQNHETFDTKIYLKIGLVIICPIIDITVEEYFVDLDNNHPELD